MNLRSLFLLIVLPPLIREVYQAWRNAIIVEAVELARFVDHFFVEEEDEEDADPMQHIIQLLTVYGRRYKHVDYDDVLLLPQNRKYGDHEIHELATLTGRISSQHEFVSEWCIAVASLYRLMMEMNFDDTVYIGLSTPVFYKHRDESVEAPALETNLKVAGVELYPYEPFEDQPNFPVVVGRSMQECVDWSSRLPFGVMWSGIGRDHEIFLPPEIRGDAWRT